MSIRIERIGSLEKLSDGCGGYYRRYQLAINGYPCVPVWMAEPEFQEYSARGDDALWNRLAFVAVAQTRNELELSAHDNDLLAGAMNEIAQRRNAA